MNRIKLTLATVLAIGSLGIAGVQAGNALSSPRASQDRIPTQKQSCPMQKKQGCPMQAKNCDKAKAECNKAEKACCKKGGEKKACCKK